MWVHKLKGHSKEQCWKIVGYPIDYKSKKKYTNKENVAYSVQGDNSKNQ